MPNFSSLTITGHLGRDPETGFLPNSEIQITKFSVAVKTGFGERAVTTWYNVAIFGKTGERAGEHLKKGEAVTLTGEFHVREYTDKSGNQRTSNELKADRWSFAGSKGGDKAAPAIQGAPVDDDIPF